jgi:hypothetical protein
VVEWKASPCSCLGLQSSKMLQAGANLLGFCTQRMFNQHSQHINRAPSATPFRSPKIKIRLHSRLNLLAIVKTENVEQMNCIGRLIENRTARSEFPVEYGTHQTRVLPVRRTEKTRIPSILTFLNRQNPFQSLLNSSVLCFAA